jgi:hypothetical protein
LDENDRILTNSEMIDKSTDEGQVDDLVDNNHNRQACNTFDTSNGHITFDFAKWARTNGNKKRDC